MSLVRALKLGKLIRHDDKRRKSVESTGPLYVYIFLRLMSAEEMRLRRRNLQYTVTVAVWVE